MNIEYDCAHCHQRLAVPATLAGQQVQCPHCQQATTAPLTSTTAPAQPAPVPPAFAPVGTPGATASANEGDATGGLIPYKNVKALLAYYLGIFSFIPCVGLPLGIAAFILGVMGLKYAKEHPAAKGQVHAWIGIIAGGGFGLLWLLAGVLMIIGAILG